MSALCQLRTEAEGHSVECTQKEPIQDVKHGLEQIWAEMKEMRKEAKEDRDKVNKTIYGNGSVGLVTDVALLKSKVDGAGGVLKSLIPVAVVALIGILGMAAMGWHYQQELRLITQKIEAEK